MPQKAMLNSSSSKVLEKHSLYQFFHIYLLKQQIFGGLLFGSGDVKMNGPWTQENSFERGNRFANR